MDCPQFIFKDFSTVPKHIILKNTVNSKLQCLLQSQQNGMTLFGCKPIKNPRINISTMVWCQTYDLKLHQPTKHVIRK